MNILDLSAEEILRINKPEKIFTKENLKYVKRKLSSKWHPDKHNGSEESNKVLSHINILFNKAEEKLNNNTWEGSLSIAFELNKKNYNFSSLLSKQFELGRVYIAKKYLLYVIDSVNIDLAKNAIDQISSIRYISDKMKMEFERQFPKIVVSGDSSIGYVVVFEKPDHAVFLNDLLIYLDNRIDPKHVAWIGSRLFNLITFLEFSNICHNDISSDTVLVSPSKHACYLIGGWWYSVKKGSKLKAIPSRLINVFPKKVLVDKIAKPEYDKQLVKSLLIECLGDSSKIGSKLLKDSTIPKPMLTWLRQYNELSTYKEFDSWYKVLEKCFGPRKFIEMKIDINQIY